MQFKRFFTKDQVKNTYLYIDSQKSYEWIRTILYFAVSVSLFVAGIVSTGSKENLLTIVAVVGCLPASKSLVSAIMFSRYKSCSKTVYDRVRTFETDISCLYDLVFTSGKGTFPIAHGAYKSGSLVLFSEKAGQNFTDLEAHLQDYLKTAQISGVTLKVYTDFNKYLDRLQALIKLESEEHNKTAEVIKLLKEITL